MIRKQTYDDADDDDKSMYLDDSPETGSGMEEGTGTEETEVIAETESKAVSKWGIVVVIMLMATAVLVVASTFVFLEREHQEFETAVCYLALLLASSLFRLASLSFFALSPFFFLPCHSSNAFQKLSSRPFITKQGPSLDLSRD